MNLIKKIKLTGRQKAIGTILIFPWYLYFAPIVFKFLIAVHTCLLYTSFDADCILVAPQNEYEYKKVRSVVNDIIPVGIINCDDFTKMDGKAVLNNAVELIENTRL